MLISSQIRRQLRSQRTVLGFIYSFNITIFYVHFLFRTSLQLQFQCKSSETHVSNNNTLVDVQRLIFRSLKVSGCRQTSFIVVPDRRGVLSHQIFIAYLLDRKLWHSLGGDKQYMSSRWAIVIGKFCVYSKHSSHWSACRPHKISLINWQGTWSFVGKK